MKLAEGLVLRKDYQKRLQQLKDRILRNCLVQEGEVPSEDPAALMEEYDKICADLDQLVQRINKANLSNAVGRFSNVADALFHRNLQRQRHEVYASIAAQASGQQFRGTRTEIKTVSVVKAADVQRIVDDAAKEARETDVLIQQANWSVDIPA